MDETGDWMSVVRAADEGDDDDASADGTSLRHVAYLPRRAPVFGQWPSWADPALVAGAAARGISRPWTHQVAAAEAIWAGTTTAIVTSTGSGKSLGFWLPVVTAARVSRAQQRRSRGLGGAPVPSAVYLSPTKALAADQHRQLQQWLSAAGIDDVSVNACDGDTPTEARRWIEEHSDIVLTNPDFLHFSLLPGHRRWTRFLRRLRYIIVDEAHTLRGVHGAHVALVLTRLRRIATELGATPPVMVVASATTAAPAQFAARLSGTAAADIAVIDQDGSPAGARTVVLWRPPLQRPFVAGGSGAAAHADRGGTRDRIVAADAVRADADGNRQATTDLDGLTPFFRVAPTDHDAAGDGPPDTDVVGDVPPDTDAADGMPPETDVVGDVQPDDDALREAPVGAADPAPRRGAPAETARLLAFLTAAGARSLAFTRSRRGAEAMAAATSRQLSRLAPRYEKAVAAYRGGYLPEERRALEAGLHDGSLRALATTNALELGIDIHGLDAVLTAGWPGSRASWWQQAGRAGRAGAPGLAVFVAREDPLDTYLVEHPAALLAGDVEANVFDPTNPYVLGPHLCAAAAEAPLRAGELSAWGPTAQQTVAELTEAGLLRARPGAWYWTRPEPATSLTDLRGGLGTVQIVEEGTAVVLGYQDAAGADAALHTGAVYTHQGTTFMVVDYQPEARIAYVRAAAVDFTTWARWDSAVRILSQQRSVTWSEHLHGGWGTVEVSTQVSGYQRRRPIDSAVLGTYPLDMPQRSLTTAGCWVTMSDAFLAAAGLTPEQLPGALHAAEHGAIGILPLLATCDRLDLGGLSTARHEQTGLATIIVHDAFPGGAGFSEHGFSVAVAWLTATRDAIRSCPCATGCPACVQSPKCGNGNQPLDKAASVALLSAIIAEATT